MDHLHSRSPSSLVGLGQCCREHTESIGHMGCLLPTHECLLGDLEMSGENPPPGSMGWRRDVGLWGYQVGSLRLQWEGGKELTFDSDEHCPQLWV
jgi:hypothetical protein